MLVWFTFLDFPVSQFVWAGCQVWLVAQDGTVIGQDKVAQDGTILGGTAISESSAQILINA